MITSCQYHDHLETARLTTRFLTPEDIPLWAQYFNDKEALQFYPPLDFSSNEDTARWWIEKQLARYRNNQFGLQALLHKDTGDFVGQCGLVTQEVDGTTEVEVAYHVFKKFWGQGFAPEAARAFIHYAFQHNLSDSVVSIIDVGNTKAQRVAEKNGLTRDKQTKWAEHDVYLYRVERKDWRYTGA